MRCVTAALVLCGFAALFQPTASTAAPMDLDTIIVDETPEQLCDRLASDPFAGFGPEEWAQPFRTIVFYRAGPTCAQAMKKHPDEPRFALGTALASIAATGTTTPESCLRLSSPKATPQRYWPLPISRRRPKPPI